MHLHCDALLRMGEERGMRRERVMLAMPTLDVNSVINPMMKDTRIRISMGGKLRRDTRDSPTCLASPEAIVPFEMANPPPKRNMRLQGILDSITFQVMRPSVDLVGLFVAVESQRSRVAGT